MSEANTNLIEPNLADSSPSSSMLFAAPTKTEDTETKYIDRAKNLIASMQQEKKVDVWDPREVAIWLLAKRRSLAKSSWRLYKAAMVYYLSTTETSEAAEAIEILKERGGASICKHRGESEKTSSTKLKRFPRKDFDILIAYLKTLHETRPKTKWGIPLAAWLRAGLLTGLRPNEWMSARIIDDGDVKLEVINSKNTNYRANGDIRRLILTGVSEADIKLISTHIMITKKYMETGEYGRYLNGCSNLMRETTRKLWPTRKRHPTLYSTRHQFAADAKSAGFKKIEIAAMMGHASDETAGLHYGRKVSGENPVYVRPDPESVDRVREVRGTSFLPQTNGNEKWSE